MVVAMNYKKRISVVLLAVAVLLSFSVSLHAEKYKIIHITNGGSVIIGGVKKKKNDTFDDTEKISWSNGILKLHIKNVRTGREEHFALAELIKNKERTIQEANNRLARLATKGQFSNNQRDLFLVDSIHIKADEVRENLHTIAEWVTIKGDTISSPVYRTSNNLFYIITSSIYQGQIPPDSILLTIRQFNADRSYNNLVYRDLKVFHIPFKEKVKKRKKYK